MVIAKAHNPIYFLQSLSEQLLKEAKKKARKEAEKEARHSQSGTVDFLVLTSEGPSSLKDFRRKLKTEIASFEEIHLTERPLTLKELEKLMEAAEQFRGKGFPRSQLYVIRQALTRGRPFSRNFLFYQLARQDKGNRQAFEKILEAWWGEGWDNDHEFPFHSKGNNEWTTPFADLVEVIDFVGEPRRNEPRSWKSSWISG